MATKTILKARFKVIAAGVAVAAALGTAASALAATKKAYLSDNLKNVVGQSGTLGTVTLTEDGWNGSFYTEIDVKVSLASGLKFIDTGNHTTFAFSTDLSPSALSFTNISTTPVGGHFVLNPPPIYNPDPPYGSFQYGFDCATSGTGSCGTGASGTTAYTSLYFTLNDANGIALSDFVQNSGKQGGWFFAADVYDSNTKKTGAIASNNLFTPAIPEPETYVMLMAGLGLMGYVVRRRKQGSNL